MDKGHISIIAALAVLAAVLVAFGPPPDDEGAQGTLRVASASAPDSLDPSKTYAAISVQVLVNTNNGLLTYRKATGSSGTELVPDIAESMPKVTNGGRTYTFTVRKGVKFGPPANRAVKASDFKYTIERNILGASQGGFLYDGLAGVDEVKAGKAKEISGIVADDASRTISFTLKEANPVFLYALAMHFSYVVPTGTSLDDMTAKGFVPATGPYMLTQFDRQRGIVLERNPSFKRWGKHTLPGKADRIEILLNISDDNAITRIRQGSIDTKMGSVPATKLPELETDPEASKRMREHPEARTAYIWMNTTVPPFDNVKVRQAVNWVIDRRAVVKLGGGTATPTDNILPPDMPGRTKNDVYPERDLEKARQLIAESGITPGELTIWCFTQPPSPDSAQYLQEQLTLLGFKPRTRCVDFSSYYSLTGAEATKAQIGFGSWGQDYPEGSNFIDILLNGDHVAPDHTNNLARYTGADAEIDRINAMLDLDERAKAWAELDRKIVEDAAWAPLSHGKTVTFVSERVRNYFFHPMYGLMFSQLTIDGSGPEVVGEKDGDGGPEGEDEGDAEGGGGGDARVVGGGGSAAAPGPGPARFGEGIA